EARVLLRLFGRRHFRELGDVRAGDEDAGLPRCDDDAFDVARSRERIDDAGELLHDPGGEFVDFFAGVVEPDDGEIALALDRECVLRQCFSDSHRRIPYARFASRRSSASSPAYSVSISALYFLSIIFRFTFSDGVIS